MKNLFKPFVLLISFAIANINLSAQVFHEDFEVVDSVNYYGTGTWAQNTRIQAGGSACDSAVVPMGGSTYLETIMFSTVGLSNVVLGFDHICRVDFFDECTIEVSNNGGASWQSLTCYQYLPMFWNGMCWGNALINPFVFSSATYLDWDPANPSTVANNSMWRYQSFNLSLMALNSDSVKVRFAINDLSTPGPNGYPGWYIDNIIVYESPYVVSGFVYNDLNSNCVFDGADTALPNIRVDLIPSPMEWSSQLTDGSGNFSLFALDTSVTNVLIVDSNHYNVNYTSSCPASYGINSFPSTGNNIGLTFSGPDLASNFFGISCRIGDTSDVQLCYNSLTPYPVSGQLQAVFSSTFTPLTGLSVPPVTQINADTLVWDLNTIPPLNTYSSVNLHCVSIPVFVDTLITLSDSLSITQNVISFNGDIFLANNTSSYFQNPCTSFDPNHKTVSPQGSIHAGDKLTYTIEFENTGTAPTQRIFVLDTLDASQLDLSSFQIEFLSHTGSVYLNQNVLLVSFNSINLAPASVNPSQSTGQFRYSIYSKQNLVTGNVIDNNAAIYFDYNAPIITNTTSTLIDNGLFTVAENIKKGTTVFPNPSHQNFYLHSNGNTKFELMDITGKAISFTQKQISNTLYQINVGMQSSGIFILKMMCDGEIKFEKVVVN